MRNLSAFLFLLITFSVSAQLKSPGEFLGYELGTKFTWHHRIVDYYHHVAKETSNMKVVEYGSTNEGRPLIVGIISSQENFDRLEEIRVNNIRMTGLEEGSPSAAENIAIVWLSYNVHGNEASSSEATMWTLYELAKPGSDASKWLDNTVVIMDPCINPDGRDRYANFYNQFGNLIPNPDLSSKEHVEPWPGARTNHYFFDLNRDWAWLTQKESRERIKLYNDWLPQVHVDFHEQGMNSPYYFPPAAEPYHEIITTWQRQFQHLIGKNHAKYFDKNGWVYFTKERFDLFYPSYGDTYPTYNGAIGMTYEKGGHGRAGLSGKMENGNVVTLHDRILHHHTTGLSTIETSSVNADRLISEFKNYFSAARSNPPGRYKSYVIKGSNHPDKLDALRKWMDKHKIIYGTASNRRGLNGFSFRSGRNTSLTIGSGDLVISSSQPKSRFVTAVFEPESRLVDSLTYDITGWALPYAYDLDAYALTTNLTVTPSTGQVGNVSLLEIGDTPYAFVNDYKSIEDQKWLAALLAKKVQVRVANKPFLIDGRSFDRGSLVVLRWDNESLGEELNSIVKSTTDKYSRNIHIARSGFVDQGKDFGSGYYDLITPPKIAVLSGPQVWSYDFGQVWYYFEQEVSYPITVVHTDYFNRIDLEDYDVLVIPGGSYRLFDEEKLKEIRGWVRSGGRLVLIGSALRAFADKDGFGLKTYRTEEEKKEAEKKQAIESEQEVLMNYDDRLRASISYNVPGAIFRVKMDPTHPLAYGYPSYYFTLKLSGSRYGYLENGGNAGILESANDKVSGFTGENILDRLDQTLVFGMEEMGRGSVVYLVDNPLFRAFWYNGKIVFGNAVFIR